MLISKETVESTGQLPCQQCLLSPIPPSYSSLKMGLTSVRPLPSRSMGTPRKPRSLTPRRQSREGCRANSWLEVDRIGHPSRRKNGLKCRSSGELSRLSVLEYNRQCGEGMGGGGLVKSASMSYKSSGELAKLSTFKQTTTDGLGSSGEGLDATDEQAGGATVRSVSCGDVAGLMGERQLKHFLKPRNKQRTVDAVALHLRDHSRDVHNWVEDRDIAARAVALVVNSTRKGIVPLCADVASLLRSKRRLEHKVQRLRGDNDVLRASLSASTRTSQSTSPVPNSLHSCDNRPHCQCSQSLCSDCSSPNSSLLENSPKLDKSGLVSQSPHHISAFISTIQASDHHPDCPSSLVCHTGTRCDRKNSLPEIVSEPGTHVMRIRPLPESTGGRVSREVQCALQPSAGSSPCMELQFKESLQRNSQLAEELGAAKREIEMLKGKLKELEMNQLARLYQDRFQVVDECFAAASSHRETPCESGQKQPVSPTNAATHKKKSFSPVTVGSPLEGCLCTNCGSHAVGEKQHSLKQVDTRLPLELGCHVVLKGEKTGVVRYLGHLDGVGQATAVFAGVQLDAPVGRHDGVLDGKRYFSSARDCGTFVPLHEVLCIIADKVSDGQKRKPSSLRIYKRSCDLDSSPSTGHPVPLQRHSSDLDHRSKVKAQLQGQRREKEGRYRAADSKDLKLPRDTNLTEGHLV